MPTEIMMLALAVVLLLVQLFMPSVSATMEMGGDYKAGPRDEPRALQGVFAGRAGRASRNLLETFPVFAALALALVVTDRKPGVVCLDIRAGRHALAHGSVGFVLGS